MNKHIIKVPRCGSVDSKYFGKYEQFEKDVEKHELEDKLFRQRLTNLMLESPSKLDKRYKSAIEVFRGLKEQYGI